MLKIHVEDLQRWLRNLSGEFFGGVATDACEEQIKKAVEILYDEMRKTAEGWRYQGEILGSIAQEVKTKGSDPVVVGEVGPGVGDYPVHAVVQEAGRRAGAKAPPYHKIEAWAYEMLGISDGAAVRTIVNNISYFGLPSVGRNPRQKHEAPTYVVRALMDKEGEVKKELDGIAHRIVKVYWSRV